LKYNGKGLVYSTDRTTITGVNTSFESQLSTRDTITLSNGTSLEVDQVISDTLVNIKTPSIEAQIPDSDHEASEFIITPHVNQDSMFAGVYDVLNQGKCVGIFPEGGSHDRPELLPLKAGFCLMALGAMEKFPDLEVNIVPVGLNYFNRDKFRSRVVVEFGDAIKITPDMIKEYRVNKRKIVSSILDSTVASLKTLTLQASDYETLMLLQATRRLYRPPNTKVSLEQNLALTRKFALGYEKFKNEPEIIQLSNQVKEYNKLLRAFGLADHQVNSLKRSSAWVYKTLAWRIFLLLFLCLPALPGLVIHAPLVLFIRDYARKKAAVAKAESSVKLEGKDVIGSWKLIIACVLFPAFYALLSLIFAICLYMMGSRLIMLKSFVFLTFVLPFLGLTTTKAYEQIGDITKSLRPLLIAAMNKNTSAVVAYRFDLSKRIEDIITLYGPKLENISPEEFEKMRLVGLKERIVKEEADKAQSDVPTPDRGFFDFGFGWNDASWDLIEK